MLPEVGKPTPSGVRCATALVREPGLEGLVPAGARELGVESKAPQVPIDPRVQGERRAGAMGLRHLEGEVQALAPAARSQAAQGRDLAGIGVGHLEAVRADRLHSTPRCDVRDVRDVPFHLPYRTV